jgi:hypothetical protein
MKFISATKSRRKSGIWGTRDSWSGQNSERVVLTHTPQDWVPIPMMIAITAGGAPHTLGSPEGRAEGIAGHPSPQFSAISLPYQAGGEKAVTLVRARQRTHEIIRRCIRK